MDIHNRNDCSHKWNDFIISLIRISDIYKSKKK